MPFSFPQRRSWQQALALSIAAGVAVGGLGTVPLLGIPGALVLIPVEPVLRMMAPGGNLFPRDSAWPFALGMTWLLGLLLPAAWMATRRWHGWVRGVLFLLLWIVLTDIGVVLFYWGGIAE